MIDLRHLAGHQTYDDDDGDQQNDAGTNCAPWRCEDGTY